MVRKHIALALATAFLTICFGCADELNSPVTTDEAPVLPPTNVQAVALNSGTVNVSWDASSQPNVVGYNVYRRVEGLGGPKQLNPARLESPHFMDSGSFPGRQYEYRVTAISSTGKESRHTSAYVVTPEAKESNEGPEVNGD